MLCGYWIHVWKYVYFKEYKWMMFDILICVWAGMWMVLLIEYWWYVKWCYWRSIGGMHISIRWRGWLRMMPCATANDAIRWRGQLWMMSFVNGGRMRIMNTHTHTYVMCCRSIYHVIVCKWCWYEIVIYYYWFIEFRKSCLLSWLLFYMYD